MPAGSRPQVSDGMIRAMTTAAPAGWAGTDRSRCGRPRRTTVAVVVDGTAHAMARDEARPAADRGWWYARRGHRPRHRRTRTPSTARTRCPTRARGGSPTGSTPRRGCGIRRSSPATGASLDRAGAAGRGDLRDARRDVHARAARFDAAVERLDHLVELGITHVEVLPGQRLRRHAGLGLRRRAVVRGHRELRRPRRVPALRRGLPRARARRRPRRRLQPSRAVGGLPRPLRAVLPRAPTSWGPSLNLDGPGSDTVRALHPRERRDVVHRLRGGRAAPRRGARAARRPGDPPARGDGDDGGRARRDAGAAVHAHRRVRPQRPAAGRAAARPAATGSTPSGATTSTTPCTRR